MIILIIKRMKKVLLVLFAVMMAGGGMMSSCSSDDDPIMTKDDIFRAIVEEQIPREYQEPKDMPEWLAERIAQYDNRDSSIPLEVWICEFLYRGQRYYSILSTYTHMQVFDMSGKQVYLENSEWEDTAKWVCIYSSKTA